MQESKFRSMPLTLPEDKNMKMPGFTADVSLRDPNRYYATSGTSPGPAQNLVNPAVSIGGLSSANLATHYPCRVVCDYDICVIKCGPVLAPPPDFTT
jgi:hypothetical protein